MSGLGEAQSPVAEILRMDKLRVEAPGENGPKRLVNDVSLTLARGEVLGLIGESGAGKSTIGLAALCYARPGCEITAGRIVLDGEDLLALSREGRRRIRGRRVAYVAQSAAAAFNPAKTINRQVCEGPVRHGLMNYEQAREQAVDLYRKLDLPSPATIGERYPHQVSGGQLQRAMAAMAMSCRPSILVLDEPTTALDVTTQIEVLATVRDLIRAEGTAALYITHDLALVAQMCDRIMVLRYGDMIEVGDTRQIIEAPRETYTQQLIAARSTHPKTIQLDDAATPLLEVRDITASYGGSVRVLENVSVRVGRGETVAVVGESGSGKSTLARVITGLLPPESGTIAYAGQPLAAALKHRPRSDLRKLQMIYQMPDTALNPRQRIGEVLGRPLGFYFGMSGQKRRDRVRELLQLIDLPPEFAERYPPELSGGQKQRVCIARALAAEPELIICDEVTSALDAIVADGILKLLERLQKEMGLAYLFITHDLGIVRNIADRVVVMWKGAVVEQGPTSEIFSPPHADYTEKLLLSVPEMRLGWLDDVLEERTRLADTVVGVN